MAMVKLQLSQLASKNRGMKAAMQEMRESVVGELMSIMKTRRIVIEQLGRERIDAQMRNDCEELLAKRKAHMIHKEDELIMLEQMLIGHEAVLEHADSACMELEAKIRAYELDRKWDGTYTLNGRVPLSCILEVVLIFILYRSPSNVSISAAHRWRNDVQPDGNTNLARDIILIQSGDAGISTIR